MSFAHNDFLTELEQCVKALVKKYGINPAKDLNPNVISANKQRLVDLITAVVDITEGEQAEDADGKEY